MTVRRQLLAALAAVGAVTVMTALLVIDLGKPARGSTPVSVMFGAGRGAQPATSARWQWPLPPPVRVVRGFDPPAQNWLPGQRGVDLAGTVGEPVLAAGDGVVGFAGTVAGIGVVTVVTGGVRTTYEPVRAAVTRGQPVHAGQRIGQLLLAGSQCLPDACLHWGLLRGSTYLDPLALLGVEQVRLLPLSPGADRG